jgi:GTP-binding protein
MSGNVLSKSLAALKKAHEVDEILPISAKTDAGIKALWSRLTSVADDL